MNGNLRVPVFFFAAQFVGLFARTAKVSFLALGDSGQYFKDNGRRGWHGLAMRHTPAFEQAVKGE